MRSVTTSVASLGLIVTFGLTACMNGTETSAQREISSSRSGQIVERDVEDPRVFSRRENALWDGRPSLGGVWVAHPDVRSPERVIIRNTENGRETIGALFRRERMNPGPAFQVSGEAANAIGILAGAPTMIEVVALRIEQIEPVQTTTAREPEAEVVSPPESTIDEQRRADETPSEALSDLTAERPETASATAPRNEGGFFGRLFRRTPRAEPPTDQIATEVLDEGAPLAATSPDARPPAPQPMQPTISALERPFIQLGIFSVEANARNAQNMAENAGLSARVIEGSTQGNAFWRVVVGPAQNAGELQQLLAQVKALGFSDAYTVRR